MKLFRIKLAFQISLILIIGTTGCGLHQTRMGHWGSSFEFTPIFPGQLNSNHTFQDLENKGLPRDTVNFKEFYLGTWQGEGQVRLNITGIPILDGVYSIDVTFSEGNHAVATTNAIEDLGPLEIVLLRGYIASLNNIDTDQTEIEAGKLATFGAIWEYSESDLCYVFTLDIKDSPEQYHIRFKGRDIMIFQWDDSEGIHEVLMYRK